MGHYASEMDPDWGKIQDRTDRLWKLKKDLAKVPMSEFKAGDAYELSQLYSVVDFGLLSDETIERFEKIARRFKSRPRWKIDGDMV